jgi:hypothetical protein
VKVSERENNRKRFARVEVFADIFLTAKHIIRIIVSNGSSYSQQSCSSRSGSLKLQYLNLFLQWLFFQSVKIFLYCAFRIEYRTFHCSMRLLLKCFYRWNKKMFAGIFSVAFISPFLQAKLLTASEPFWSTTAQNCCEPSGTAHMNLQRTNEILLYFPAQPRARYRGGSIDPKRSDFTC